MCLKTKHIFSKSGAKVARVPMIIMFVETCDSSSLVRLGKTKVICGISGELVQPEAATPGEGILAINFEFSSVSSPGAKSGAPSEFAQSTSIFLDNIIRQVLDLSELCIVEDKLVWTLFIDLYCLEGKFSKIYFILKNTKDDGNVTDAALMALVSAIKNLSLSNVSFDDNEKMDIDRENKSTKLNLRMHPVSTTYGEFGGILLLDPTAREIELGSSPITVVCSETGDLLGFNRPGGAPLSKEQIAAAISESKKRSVTVYQEFYA